MFSFLLEVRGYFVSYLAAKLLNNVLTPFIIGQVAEMLKTAYQAIPSLYFNTIVGLSICVLCNSYGLIIILYSLENMGISINHINCLIICNSSPLKNSRRISEICAHFF